MTADASKGRSRHLQWDVLERSIGKAPRTIPIAGKPKIALYIEPDGKRLGARFFSKPHEPSTPSPLAEVAIRWITVDGGYAIEVSTGDRELYRDFYQFVCSVADRIQIKKQAPQQAIRQTLESLSKLTRQRKAISPERRIGLFGELLYLKVVARHLGWRTAIGSWKGCDAQEHDFTLPGSDLEIKTTVSERRIHHITTLTQLMPKPGRPLFLVSIQITPVSDTDGESLGSLVSSVVSEAEVRAPDAADLLRNQIRLFGWSDDDAARYGECYVLRSGIQAIAVDQKFPSITPGALSFLDERQLSRIDNVSYTVNVEGLGAPDTSPVFLRAVFPKGKK